MVVLCCIVVVTGFLPFLVSRSSLSSPPSQVDILLVRQILKQGGFIGISPGLPNPAKT